MLVLLGGHLDDLPIDQVRDFEAELYKYMDAINPNLAKSIEEKKTLDDALKADMKKTLDDFKKTFVSSRQAVAVGA